MRSAYSGRTAWIVAYMRRSWPFQMAQICTTTTGCLARACGNSSAVMAGLSGDQEGSSTRMALPIAVRGRALQAGEGGIHDVDGLRLDGIEHRFAQQALGGMGERIGGAAAGGHGGMGRAHGQLDTSGAEADRILEEVRGVGLSD